MKKVCYIALALSAALVAGSALADKPAWAGNGKEGKHGNKHEERRDERGGQVTIHFGDSHRRAVADYYGVQFRSGKCPPGLAKKNNGCLPPGQAKKWHVGRPLPADLRYYGLPRDLMVRLPPPPAGHRYVRVAADILLIAIGTSMVIDAIEDIGR